MDVVFLGANNVGFEVYEWLCDRESVTVHAMLTRKEQLGVIRDIEPEIVVAAGFRDIVPLEILEVPEQGCINLHPGLVPHGRGFNPNVWSIVDDVPAGVTLHYMAEAVDAGDVIATREVETTFADTGRDLYERLEATAIDLFVETWPQIETGKVDPTPQDEAAASYHYKREFHDLCELDPDARYTVKELLDVLRALTFPPFANAYVELDGRRYYLELDITPEAEIDSERSMGLLSSY